MRPAAAAWESDYAEKLQSMRFQEGRAVPTISSAKSFRREEVVMEAGSNKASG